MSRDKAMRMPPEWPKSQRGMKQFLRDLDTLPADGVSLLDEMFGKEPEYYRFLMSGSGQVRIYQFVASKPRAGGSHQFAGNAIDVLDHLDALDGMSDDDYIAARTALWEAWKIWVCDQANKSTAISAS